MRETFGGGEGVSSRIGGLQEVVVHVTGWLLGLSAVISGFWGLGVIVEVTRALWMTWSETGPLSRSKEPEDNETF